MISRLSCSLRLPCRHWKIAECSLSIGQQRHVMLMAGGVDKGSGHDQRFLIRQRDIVTRFNRLQRRLQADKPTSALTSTS